MCTTVHPHEQAAAKKLPSILKFPSFNTSIQEAAASLLEYSREAKLRIENDHWKCFKAIPSANRK